MALVESPLFGDADTSNGTKYNEEVASNERWIVTDRKEKLLHYKIPEFIPPYPSGISRYTAKVTKDTYDWLLEHGVDKLFPPKAYDKFVDFNLPGLPARVYVEYGPQTLDWASKFFTWLFLLDDILDNTAVGMKRGTLVPVFFELHLLLLWNFPDDPVLNNSLSQFLNEFPNSAIREQTREFISEALKKNKNVSMDTAYDGKMEPIGALLRDLWASSLRTMPAEFNLRLAHTIQDYFLGDLSEAINREDKTIPSIAEYTILRRKSGAVEPTIVIFDLYQEVYMPNELFFSSPMKEMMDAVNDIIVWHNDIMSFKKEMTKGDHVHNLVTLISYERKDCTYQECAHIALDMIYDRIAHLEKAGVDLLSIAPPAYQTVVQRYIKTCQYWVSGTHAWHSLSVRYQ
ncbi:unnamed protein product [Calypogeia fissa]